MTNDNSYLVEDLKKRDKKIDDLAQDVYDINVEKGFWDEGKNRNVGETLALIHSEISEALEAHRKDKPKKSGSATGLLMDATSKLDEGEDKFMEWYEEKIKDTFEDELVDAIIRILDTYRGYKEIEDYHDPREKHSIEDHIKMKLVYNKLRSYKGKRY